MERRDEGSNVPPSLCCTLGVPPTCSPGMGEPEVVALGEVSLWGLDRNQPNHRNPELWQGQVSVVKAVRG